MSRKDRNAREKLDHYSASYRQGYWDGVRASEEGVSTTGSVDTPSSPQQLSAYSPISSAITIGQPPAPESFDTPRKDSHLTVNVALYVASLLLIGGVSLFVNAYTPGPVTTFFFVLITAAAYYGFGFLLYRSTPILKPVSIAFVGTALAIMPYVGYLLNQSFVHNPNISWLITSLVCLVVYLHAAIRLHSELIGYFIIVLIVSTADSLAGVFGADILWFIVLVMASGAIITLVAAARPPWLPDVLKQPFIATQHLLVPLAVVWSLFLYDQLDAAQYAIVFATATLYYGAAALQAEHGSTRRTWLWAATRATITVAVSLFVYDKTDSSAMFGVSLAVIGALQVALSAYSLPQRDKLINQHELWLWGGFSLIVIAAYFSNSDPHWAAQIAMELAGLTVIAAIVAMYLKRSELFAFSVYGLILLPLIGGHFAGPLALPDWVTCVIYSVLLIVAVITRMRFIVATEQNNMALVYVAQVGFSLMVIGTAMLASTSTNHWWFVFAWAIVAIAAYFGAWIEKDYRVAIAANMLSVVALGIFADAIGLHDMQIVYFMAALSLVGFYGAYIVLEYKNVGVRIQQTMAWSAIFISTFLSIMGLFSSDDSLVSSFVLLLLVAGSVLIYDDYEKRTLRFTDIGLVVASLGLLRFLGIVAPNISGLFYSHWWMILAFVLAYLRLKYSRTARDKDLSLLYQVTGLLVMTLYGFVYTKGYAAGGSSSIVFLVEHVGVVIYGLIRNNRLFTIWGAVGVTLAILALMPGYSFILLPLLGLGMIAAVIHVVTRNKTPPPPQVG